MLERPERFGGGTYSKFVQLIRQTGYNKDVDIELGAVTASPPEIRIKIDNMPIELEADDLIIAEHLMKHSRKVMLTNSGNTSLSSASVSEKVEDALVGGPYQHTHDITQVTLNAGNFTLTEGTLTFLDELKEGDKVIVASANQGQTYFVLDRVYTIA